MKYDIFSSDGRESRPLCRIDIHPAELRHMAEALLSDIFSFTEDGGAPYTLTARDGDFVITDLYGAFASVPRPVSQAELRDAAAELLASHRKLRFITDPSTGNVSLGDKSVILTPTEFMLFSTILEKGDRLSSATELSETVWGKIDRNLCTVYLSYLRRKLDGTFGDGTLISVRGKGYRLRGFDE